MAQDIIDHRLIGAIHVAAMNRERFNDDETTEHVAFQAGTLSALMQGEFEGDVSLGELIAHGDVGIGTVQRLAGELVIVDSVPYLIDASGVVTEVPVSTLTPFAVVTKFTATATTRVNEPLNMTDLAALTGELSSAKTPILAIRIDGTFFDLHLRSIHEQHPPYPSLVEVAKDQTDWRVENATGTVVGFSFPDTAVEVEVPGYHLHFISDDRTQGGHILDMSVESGSLSIDGSEDLHIELPGHIELGSNEVDEAIVRSIESD